MTKKKILVSIGILAALCGCGYQGYAYYHTQQEMQEKAKEETTKVVRTDIRSTVSATGVIRPVNSVEISSNVFRQGSPASIGGR